MLCVFCPAESCSADRRIVRKQVPMHLLTVKTGESRKGECLWADIHLSDKTSCPMWQEELIMFSIRKDRNIFMRSIRRMEQHRSSGRILRDRISWIFRQAEQQENVLKDGSLSLHFRKVLLSTRQMMW